MEHLCALLTGFFLWLFLFHWVRSSLARSREAVGALLIEVAAGRKQRRMARLIQIQSYLITLVLLGLAILMQRIIASHERSAVDDFLAGTILFQVLQTVFPAIRVDAAQELRERGVVRAIFWTPWGKVRECRWHDKWVKRDARRHTLLIERGDRRAEEVEAINAAVARFVPVYDENGTLVAEPDAAERENLVALSRRSVGWRFQFSLQSVLLLMVVVSCAASCYGIHYRRALPQHQAVATFGRFKPIVYENGDDVWLVDFKACALKPGDDDLAALAALPNLEYVHLDGAPITDAGLKHLRTLKKLKMVTLSNTKVTQTGVDELKRALPKATISHY